MLRQEETIIRTAGPNARNDGRGDIEGKWMTRRVDRSGGGGEEFFRARADADYSRSLASGLLLPLGSFTLCLARSGKPPALEVGH